MGEFVFVSAFRGADSSRTATALELFCARHGVRTVDQPLRAPTVLSSAARVRVWGGGDWTVVDWPMTFPHTVAALEMSETLACIAVAADIYEGAFWRQTVVQRGTVVDRFCSELNYFGREERQRLGGRWDGNSGVVADMLGLDPKVVQHYYRQPTRFRQRKGLQGDTFNAVDPWIFTDLWRRIGISYPSGPPDLVLELPRDFANDLPTEGYDF